MIVSSPVRRREGSMAKKNMTSAAEELPALRDYLNRIGAEELNFRRFMVKERKGGHYYTERVLIKILGDGEIRVTDPEYAPTKEEAEKIAEGFAKLDLPKSIGATKANVDELRSRVDGELFSFISRKEKDAVIMCQQRVETADGGKFYMPWTYWSDGRWRAMEPDGPLPFWKPEKRRKGTWYMIHEGAKSAAAAEAIARDPKSDHPWAKELSKYEHWGMIGGALAPHRADYDELKSQTPEMVVYVCDHDKAGETVAQEFSKHYRQKMRAVMFPDSFPESFDIAEPMPANLFHSSGRYCGPQLSEIMQPATWATEPVYTGKKGRPSYTLNRAFRDEWLHAIKPEVFVHLDWSHEVFNPTQFNNKVKPFSHVANTAALLQTDAGSKSCELRYTPSERPGVYSTPDSARYINTHRPSSIVPEKGDVGPFLDFMTHLVVDPNDRLELMRWCATLIARPEIKMLYGVLLISEAQGVGKGTLGEKILAPIIGHDNVSIPSEHEVVESAFNYWATHKRLAVVHEIYSGHSSKAYDKLKSIMTDKFIRVKKKFQDEYEIDNWLHIFACSNSMRAIRLSDEDRRWFVPQITDEKMEADYWINFNRWLVEEGGLQFIAQWAHDFLERELPVMTGDTAPGSKLKQRVVEDGYSAGQLLVATTLDRIHSILAKEGDGDEDLVREWEEKDMLRWGENGEPELFVLDQDLVRLIHSEIYQERPTDKLEKPATVRKLAKARGWSIGTQKVSTGMRAWGPGASNSYMICTTKKLASMTPSEVGGNRSERGQKPLSLEWARTQ